MNETATALNNIRWGGTILSGRMGAELVEQRACQNHRPSPCLVGMNKHESLVFNIYLDRTEVFQGIAGVEPIIL